MITKEQEAEILRLHHVEKWLVGTIAGQLRVRVRLFCGNLEWSDLGHLTLLRRGLGTGSGSGISPFA